MNRLGSSFGLELQVQSTLDWHFLHIEVILAKQQCFDVVSLPQGLAVDSSWGDQQGPGEP